jgi:hypothetical protein
LAYRHNNVSGNICSAGIGSHKFYGRWEYATGLIFMSWPHSFLLIILTTVIALFVAFAILGELGVVPKLGELLIINIPSVTGSG